MPAIIYDSLGNIDGVKTTTSIPSSKRSRDGDRFQTFSFEIDSAFPFTGHLYIQGSVDDPTIDAANFKWFDIVEILLYGQDETIFVEPEIEVSSVRVESKFYDTNAAISSGVDTSVVTSGTFQIDGNNVAVTAGDDLAAVALAITTAAIPNITASTTLVQGSLVITKTNGTTFTIEDTVNTPLRDIGVQPFNAPAGARTLNPNGTIKTIKVMR